jgi:hypothetical protein
MTELTIKEEESPAFEPPTGPSTIIVQVIEGENCHLVRWDKDKSQWLSRGLDIGESAHEGRDAYWEIGEGGMLDVIVEQLAPEDLKPGWWLIVNFTASYYQDYWGEYDVDYDCGEFRPATPEEIEKYWGSQQS